MQHLAGCIFLLWMIPCLGSSVYAQRSNQLYILETQSGQLSLTDTNLSQDSIFPIVSLSENRHLVRASTSAALVYDDWLTPLTTSEKYLTTPYLTLSNVQPIKHYFQYSHSQIRPDIRAYAHRQGLSIRIIDKNLRIGVVTLTTQQVMDFLQQDWLVYLQPVASSSYDDTTSFNGQNFFNPVVWPYSGKGVRIAIGDDGVIGPHLDFDDRLLQLADAQLVDGAAHHADRVAGVVGGAGHIQAHIQGTAVHSQLLAVDAFQTIEQGTDLHLNHDITLTCTPLSDGCGSRYGALASLADYQQQQHPKLLHIFSAGNSGLEDCGYGAGVGWGTISGDAKQCKNGITVGNLSAYSEIAPTSSRGPTQDGRLKPDICTRGEGLYTTIPSHEYSTFSGTSAAAPRLTGFLAQMQEAFQEFFPHVTPSGPLMKAILLNSAQDIGPEGPDFTYGFGRADVHSAIELIKSGHFYSGELYNQSQIIRQIQIPDQVAELRVMLYWQDPAGHPLSENKLVNDLDILVEDVHGNVWQPLVLDATPNPIALSRPAVQGKDTINNVEQVVIPLPEPGTYRFLVKASRLSQGKQRFHVTYQYDETSKLSLHWPKGGESVEAGSQVKIHWSAKGITQKPFTVFYQFEHSQEWITLGSTTLDALFLQWQVPNMANQRVRIRVSHESGVTVESDWLHITKRVQQVEVVSRCGNVAHLKWEMIPEATTYEVLQFKDGAFHVSTSTSDTEASIRLTTQKAWVSVVPVFEQGQRGIRSHALCSKDLYVNCEIDYDLSMYDILSPSGGNLTYCGWIDSLHEVRFSVMNTGKQVLNDPTFSYQWDDAEPVTQSFQGVLIPNILLERTVMAPVSIIEYGTHRLKVWVSHPQDQNPYNDTATVELTLVPGELYDLPYIENFDEMLLCNSYEECRSKCELSGGWSNTLSHLDWLVHTGITATPMTGPNRDQNSNSPTGKYLYLESSGGCDIRSGILTSPCLDLRYSEYPELHFWVHMSGQDIGSFHVDVFDGLHWQLNVMPPLVQSQGAEWKPVSVPLHTWSGQIVQLRFRANTTGAYYGDIAIDQVAVFDREGPPLSHALISPCCQVCVGEQIDLKDNSFNDPDEWNWVITPDNATFVQGTDANSQHPSLVFKEAGSYRVKLYAKNNYGASVSETHYVSVSTGESLPVLLDFEEKPLMLSGWTSHFDDARLLLQQSSAVSMSGDTSTTLKISSKSAQSNSTPPKVWILESPTFSLTSASAPVLRLDLAACASHSSSNDSIEIKVSTDCQEQMDVILYKGLLSDFAFSSEDHHPVRPYHWKSLSLDLSPYVNKLIRISIRTSHSNQACLFIDNIIVAEQSDLPSAIIFPPPNNLCINEEFQLKYDLNLQGDDSIQWLFYMNDSLYKRFLGTSLPAFKVTQQGSWQLIGIHRRNGYATLSHVSFQVYDAPLAIFDYFQNAHELWFQNESTQFEYLQWDFGDGTLSQQEHPFHIYEMSGFYKVTLRADNNCGSDTYTDSVRITIENTLQLPDNGDSHLRVYPNPTGEYLYLKTPSSPGCKDAELHFFNAMGQWVSSQPWSPVVSVDRFPNGLYWLLLTQCDRTYSSKVMVLR